MAEETVPVPAEAEKMEESAAPSTSAEQADGGEDVDNEAKKLMGAGRRHMVMKDVRSAVNSFQEASSLLGKKYGETADQCADAFFSYGMALLELARMENGVLGNALEGMPEEEEEDGEKEEDPNIPSASNLDEKEREQLREQVYDAMAEQEKPEKSEAEETKTEKAENGDVHMEENDKPTEGEGCEKKTNGEMPVSDQKADEAEKSAVTEEKAATENEGKTDEAMDEAVTEEKDASEGAAEDLTKEKSEGDVAKDLTKEKSEGDVAKDLAKEKSEGDVAKESEDDVAKDLTKEKSEGDVAKEKTEEKGEAASEDVSEEESASKAVTEEKSTDESKSEEMDVSKKAEKTEVSEPAAQEAASSDTPAVSEPTLQESEVSKTPTEETEGVKPPAEETAAREQPEGEDAEGDEEAEPMEGEEEGAADSEDGEENEGTEEKENDEDEVGNLQLAWEMLDLSKVIFKRQQDKEAQLKAAQAHLKLGEVSIESENYDQATEDFLACLNIQKKHLDEHDRLLAETHYQLGLAYQYSSKHDSAISHFTQSTEVIEKRVAVLTEQLEKAASETTEELQKEMDELKGLLPDIREKIEDSKEAQKTAAATERALKETLIGASSGFSQENGSTSSASVAPAEKSTDSTVPVTANCISDISHLVRKKRKPEDESPLKDAKKSKSEPVENGAENGSGDAVVPTNEDVEKAGETENQTPMETTAVESTA